MSSTILTIIKIIFFIAFIITPSKSVDELTEVIIYLANTNSAHTAQPTLITLWFGSFVYEYELDTNSDTKEYITAVQDMIQLGASTCPNPKIMIENDSSNSLLIDKIRVDTESGKWYGIRTRCFDDILLSYQPFLNDPEYINDYLEDDATCDSGKANTWFCIEDQLDACLPFKQILYFDMSAVDTSATGVSWEDASVLSDDEISCVSSPTQQPTPGPTSNSPTSECLSTTPQIISTTSLDPWSGYSSAEIPVLGETFTVIDDATYCYAINPCIKIIGIRDNDASDVYIEQTLDVLNWNDVTLHVEVTTNTFDTREVGFVETICDTDSPDRTEFNSGLSSATDWSGCLSVDVSSCGTLTIRIGGYLSGRGDEVYLTYLAIEYITSPTSSVSIAPTKTPSDLPTKSPSADPTKSPSVHPVVPPTENPSESPTKSPTMFPTAFPTETPSKSPTKHPTHTPTLPPTFLPSDDPTRAPFVTAEPTSATMSPNKSPTLVAVEGNDPTESLDHEGSEDDMTTTNMGDVESTLIGKESAKGSTDGVPVLVVIVAMLIILVVAIIVLTRALLWIIKKSEKSQRSICSEVSYVATNNEGIDGMNENAQQIQMHQNEDVAMDELAIIGDITIGYIQNDIVNDMEVIDDDDIANDITMGGESDEECEDAEILAGINTLS
eukprot:861102_1